MILPGHPREHRTEDYHSDTVCIEGERIVQKASETVWTHVIFSLSVLQWMPLLFYKLPYFYNS